MKSITRGFALALLVGVVAAFPTAASASGGFTADKYTATIQGNQVANSFGLQVGPGGGSITCEKASFGATLNQPSPGLVTTSFKNPDCGATGGLEMKGCQFELHPGAGTLDIGPSGCGPVNLFVAVCAGGSFSIPAQTGISAKYENLGSGSEASVQVAIEDKDLEYTTGGNLCKAKGTYKDLSMYGKFKITAADSGGKATGIKVINGDVPLGLFLAGGGGAGEPRLAAPSYPAHVTGERVQLGSGGQITLFERASDGVKISCKVAQMDGGTLAGPAYNSFSLTAAYSQCTTAGLGESVVKMNDCSYVYSNLEPAESSAYVGKSEISCKAGSSIKIEAPGCKIELPAQVLAGKSAALENLYSGYEAAVGMVMTGSGVKYTTSGAFCFLAFSKLSGEDGTSRSEMLLHGVYPG